jgi:DNA-binding MarR family transcriptional regulator
MNDSVTVAPVEPVKGTMFSLLRAAEAVEGRLEDALGGVGLSMPKFSVLTQLAAAREPMALCDLASRLSCVRSNVTQLMDRLEADGLVERVADPNDRRSVRAALTPVGAERCAAGQQAVEMVQAEFAQQVASTGDAPFDKILASIK